MSDAFNPPKPKAATVTVTGTVERAEVKLLKPYVPHYYSPNEHHDVKLDVALRLDDGSYVYFMSPAAHESIGSAPGVAVVTYRVDGGSKDWFHETGGSGVATPGRPNENRLEPLVKVGDRITVTGRVKKDWTVSKYGKKYRTLNYVRLEN